MTDQGYVVVHTAPDFFSARHLAGLLESEGITARIPGSELMDEFGMGQKLAAPKEVIVLERDVERARDIVAAWEARPGAEDAS